MKLFKLSSEEFLCLTQNVVVDLLYIVRVKKELFFRNNNKKIIQLKKKKRNFEINR